MIPDYPRWFQVFIALAQNNRIDCIIKKFIFLLKYNNRLNFSVLFNCFNTYKTCISTPSSFSVPLPHPSAAADTFSQWTRKFEIIKIKERYFKALIKICSSIFLFYLFSTSLRWKHYFYLFTNRFHHNNFPVYPPVWGQYAFGGKDQRRPAE